MTAPGPGPAQGTRIRIAMPHHLRNLAGVRGEVEFALARPVTIGAALDALEGAHPNLVGTVRDRRSGKRRPMIRIYAAGEDYSDMDPHTPLPESVVEGREPLRLVGAIAGG